MDSIIFQSSIRDLIQSVSNALSCDENVWISMLELSVKNFSQYLVKKIDIDVDEDQNNNDPYLNTLKRLVSQITSFMEQESQVWGLLLLLL